MTKLLILTTLFFFLSSAQSQPIDKNIENKVIQQVFDELTKRNFVKLNRVTTEGKLSSCELEFQYVYKDFRAKKGALINTTGSFSAMYFSEKTPSYSLKLNAQELDLFSEQKWNSIEPAYTNIKFKNIDFSKFKTIDFTCETGGKCTGYSDNSLKLNLDLASTKEFEPEIFFSLSKGGYDNLLKLSTLMPQPKAKAEFNSFRMCHEEILIMVADDLRNLIKK